MRQWLNRLHRALRLDAELFEEVEHDLSAGPQALLVVLLASTCGGIGNLEARWILGLGGRSWPSLVVLTAGFVVAWIVWSFLTMAVGTTLFRGRADMGEMQRALGFAAAPGVLMLVPGLGVIVGVPWSLMAMVVAVRQALDFDTRRAIGTVVVAASVMALVVLPAGCFLHGRGLVAAGPGAAPPAEVAREVTPPARLLAGTSETGPPRTGMPRSLERATHGRGAAPTANETSAPEPGAASGELIARSRR